MIKFAVAGSLNYLSKIEYLTAFGYSPQLVIGSEPIFDFEKDIKERGIELLVCFAYPNILTKNEIKLFTKGCINYHSGLPKYRGRHPLNWMLIDGLSRIPNAIHYINEDIDAGDIILECDIIKEREDDYKTIVDKQSDLSQRMMLAAIKMIEAGTVFARKQIPEDLGYTRKRTPDDSRIDFGRPSTDVHNFICALVDPMPNAFCHLNGETVGIKKSEIGSAPGIVLGEVANRKYVVSTGDGVVLVETDVELNVDDKLL